MPRYSASMLDRATVGCFLVLHAAAMLPKENIIQKWTDDPMHHQPSQHLYNQLAFWVHHVGITTPDPSCYSHMSIVDARTEGAQQMASALIDHSDRIANVGLSACLVYEVSDNLSERFLIVGRSGVGMKL